MPSSIGTSSVGSRRSGLGKGVVKFICLLISLLLGGGVPSLARGDGDQDSEYQVKGAFIYHFARYVEWPSEATGATLTVCVLGNSSFGNTIGSIAGKSVRGRRVVVSYVRRPEDLQACDILFVCVSERGSLGQILAQVRNRPILTVSDIKRFAAAGGMIGFVPVGEKVRFEINQRAARHAKLQISAQLLKLATSVIE